MPRKPNFLGFLSVLFLLLAFSHADPGCPKTSPLVNSESEFKMLQLQLRGSIQIIDDCSFKVSDFDMLPGSDIHRWGAAAPDFTNLTDRLVEKGDTQLAAVLREIQPLLEDAQRRQLKDVFVRKWLCDFTDAVYNLEELLDEWDTALLKIKIQKLQFGISKKVRFCILNSFLCFCQVRRVGQRRQIAVEIESTEGEVECC
ncbi:hypothetical protein ACFX15_012792 [Malus domestica]